MSYCNSIVQSLLCKLQNCSHVYWVSLNVHDDAWYTSKNPGVEIDADFNNQYTDDIVDMDLNTGKVYCGKECYGNLFNDVKHIFDWYKDKINGGNTMSKKEINEAIRNDIQTLANDLTKKREMDKANSSAEDIAKKLGVKLPKSKK